MRKVSSRRPGRAHRQYGGRAAYWRGNRGPYTAMCENGRRPAGVAARYIAQTGRRSASSPCCLQVAPGGGYNQNPATINAAGGGGSRPASTPREAA